MSRRPSCRSESGTLLRGLGPEPGAPMKCSFEPARMSWVRT
jgi:hypothetical protein